MEKNGRISSIDESDIGIHIVDSPFSYYFYRKDSNEKLFDTSILELTSGHSSNHFYDGKNFIQIASRLPQGHFTYGLKDYEKAASLRLIRGKYCFSGRNESFKDYELKEGYSNSMPYYLTVNPQTQNAWGSLIFNFFEAEASLGDDFIHFKINSENLEMYIFAGPGPLDVVTQLQQTLGFPLLQKFSHLNWHANIVTSSPRKDIEYILDNILAKDTESQKNNTSNK